MQRDPNISVIPELGDDIHWTTGDVTQIKMVFEVVLSNAFEALHRSGGCVKITTGHRLVGRAGRRNRPADETRQLYLHLCWEITVPAWKKNARSHF